MAIYTDRIHIVSDDGLQELHRFAKLLGLRSCWFDCNPKHPHYDFPKIQSGGILREQLIADAFTLGAIECTTRDIVEIFNKLNS